MAVSYAPIPDIPLEGLSASQFELFKSIKENLEVLSGARGLTGHAVTNDSFSVVDPNMNNVLQFQRTAGQPGWYTNYPSGVGSTPLNILNIADYANLINDVATVAADVKRLQAVVAQLITILRS